MDAPDLIIPVRMDTSKAIAGLTKVGGAGKKAGDDVAAGAAKGKKGLDGDTGGADKFGSNLGGSARAAIGLQAIKATASGMGSAFNDTAKYVQEMAKEFQGLRKFMREVATLKGKANTTEFTLEEAEQAKTFHLTPQEYRDFQAEFRNYVGSQVGTDEATGGIAKGAKLTEKQGEEYAGRVAGMMKASGIAPSVGAELAGSLLAQKQGPQEVDELMKELNRTFTVLEKGRTPLKQALPQMSQIMGHGVGAEEAAKLFSVIVPASPGDPGVAVESALKAIEEIKAKGTGEEFGVKRGMGQYESFKAFAQNVNARKQKLVSQGKTGQEAEDEVTALLQERGVDAHVREKRGLIAGAARQGVELGASNRYEEIAKATPEDLDAQRKRIYEASERGRQDAIDVAEAIADAKMGARNAPVAKWRKIAEIELKEGGAFEKVQPAAEAASHLPGASDARTILINQQANHRVRAMLGESGAATDMFTATNQGLTDQLLRELLKRLESIDEETKKANAKKMAGAEPPRRAPGGAPPGKPLDARPPGGDNKRQ